MNSVKLSQPEVHHIEWFFEYAYSYLPIFHLPFFIDQIANADTSALYAMSALGLRYHLIRDKQFKGDFTEPDSLFREAKRLAEIKFATPKLCTLQTLILLEAYATRKPF